MTHIYVAVDHSLGDINRICEWITSRKLKDKNSRCRYAGVRQLSILDIVVEESCIDELLSYLNLDVGHVDKKKMSLINKIIHKFSPLLPVNTSHIKRRINHEFPEQLFAYFHILGKIPDNKNEDGIDML